MRSPNIILMMCDDLGYGDVGFNGNEIIKTPNLDKLASRGIRFTRFYAGGPVCSPTRGTCLTGRHYFRYGVTHANRGHLPAQEITLARMLKSFGYATGHFGKWHLGTLDPNYSGKPNRNPARNYAPPWERDYDASFATEYAVPTWDPAVGVQSGGRRSDRPWASPYYENGELTTENLKGCDSRVLMDRAIAFIEQTLEKGEPFFTTIWFHAPHTPVFAGPEYRKMYAEYTEAVSACLHFCTGQGMQTPDVWWKCRAAPWTTSRQSPKPCNLKCLIIAPLTVSVCYRPLKET